MKVLVIGASGRVGSAVTAACLAKGHSVTAFLRTPSKLPSPLKDHTKLHVVQGDATVEEDLLRAMKGQDAVVQAAIYGSNTPWGTSDSELVTKKVVTIAKQIQLTERTGQSKNTLRLWIISGQVVMDIPGTSYIEGDVIPIHPEHHKNYAYMIANAEDLDWSLICPGKLLEGEPAGPLVRTVDHVGLWSPPGIIGRVPFIGALFNVVYNFSQQRLSYKGIGDFLADNLGPGGDMRGKRVGLLENPHSA